MPRKQKYTDEPLEFGGPVEDKLPPPAEIRKLEARVIVRLDLSSETVEFFRGRAKAGPRGTSFQALMSVALDEYVNRHS